MEDTIELKNIPLELFGLGKVEYPLDILDSIFINIRCGSH